MEKGEGRSVEGRAGRKNGLRKEGRGEREMGRMGEEERGERWEGRNGKKESVLM